MCRVRGSAAGVLAAARGVLWALAALALAGCAQKMADQPSYRTFDPSTLFPDGASARPPVPGAIPVNAPPGDSLFQTGMVAGRLSEVLPYPATREMLERGRQRFEIYCSPCHDRLGTGRGMVVRRGFSPPPSFHTDRLRAMPVGHFFDVMTRGFGAMPSYAGQVEPSDRWAIAGYIRVLQLSQNVRIGDLPDSARARLESEPSEGGR